MKILNYLLIFFLSVNLILLKCALCFDVKFRAVYNEIEIEPFNTQIYKREMAQFFDKASYSFNGFKKVESIPVLFPIDICILNLEGVKYAASLHKKANGTRYFAVHKMNNGTYQLVADLPTPHAIAMDCRGLGARGYIALAYNFSSSIENAREGSPIYELIGDHVRAIQYFAAANLVNVYLRVQGNDLMLLQTFKNTKSTPNLYCPYFKWSGSTFNRVGSIPCSNARHLEPFSIDYENYVAVANFADQRGRTSTYSEIYKFVREKKKFQLFQKIKTNGAVDVRYFSVPVDEARRQHFLIFGNSLSSSSSYSDGNVKAKNLEADSIFYVFDKGQFVPYQRLTFYAVEQFLPIQNIDAEKFLLLVASSNQEIKIYNLNDWKFEESKAQFTEGALGKGVARMRIFQEQEESYLVIANEKMADNETNIFLPIFKQEEHANALRQQIIDWAKENMARLKNIDVEKLKHNVEQKLQNPYSTSSHQITDIPNAHIESVITESLTSPRLHMDSNYWKALSYAQLALNVLEKEQKPHQMSKREANNYDFETIKVDTLLVRHKLEANIVNGIQSKSPEFDHVTAKQIVVTGKYYAPALKSADLNNITLDDDVLTLNVENLNLTGTLNGWSWHDLLNQTLKRQGLQFIKSPANIQSLSTETMTVTNEKVNSMNLAKLITINGGNYVVFQHILFESPITAKNVIINERLNQIHVLNRKFDVLLKKSNKTQVITGPKRMSNVRLMQPIILASSVSSNHLRVISPSRAIHKDLVLQGDFVINGDVIIRKALAATDLWDTKLNASLKTNLSNGLRVDASLEDVVFKFISTIEANNSIVSFVNTKDMQQLLKTNTSERQVVEGLKVFKQNLIIENGLNEVQFINEIDTENLAEELLLKSSNQTVTAPMHFNRIIAKGLKATKLSMHNKQIHEFLSKSGKQHISGQLKVEKLKVENFVAKNLNTNEKIFDSQLADIYKQNYRKSHKSNILQTTPKVNGTVYVKNLIINGNLNGKLVRDLEQQLQQLVGSIKYIGNYSFHYEMNIKNLTFLQHFNGIAAAEFGKCWLQKTGTQVFTAPQTFASAKFDKGAALAGSLNGFALRDFYEQTYWIDRDEYINEAQFQNPIELQKSLNTRTLANLNVPGDYIYRNSEGALILKNALVIEGNLKVEGSILNTTNINYIDLVLLKEFLYSPPNRTTLHVRSANFSFAPKFQTLNKYNIREMLNTIWLANENVELTGHVEINEGNFQGLLNLEGPINNMDLAYLQEHYLSRRKPQTILTEAMLTRKTAFESIESNEINLMGKLMDAASKSAIKFDEFVSNTLKTSGNHEVRNNWTLLEVAIAGSLNDVTVNELNLAKDVVRLDEENFITAEKRIPATAVIEKLYTKQQNLINGVDISYWFQNAVYFNGNQTIYGSTTLENANIGDLSMTGFVNNMKFSKDNLWLRNENQYVPGKVSICNKLASESSILVNNIRSLDVEYINAKNVSGFLEGLAKRDKSSTLNVDSHLIFEQPLVVTDYSNDGKMEDLKWKRQAVHMANDWNGLTQAIKKLRSFVLERENVLKVIKFKEVLPINSSNMIYLPILKEDEMLNLIGLRNDSSTEAMKPLIFYLWSTKCDCFIQYNEELSWLPKDPHTLELLIMLLGTTDYIMVNKPKNGHIFGNNTISSDGLKDLLNIKSMENQVLTHFKLQNQDCFMVFGRLGKAKNQIYCLDFNVENPLMKFSFKSELEADVKQMIMLSDNLIALLVGKTVEIWNTYEDLELQERLLLANDATQLATCSGPNGVIFLAIATSGKSRSLLKETVEIYSFSNSTNLRHQQTIIFDTFVDQVELHFLNESQDLLLLIRSKLRNKSLVIYQHQGVKGFQQIFSVGTLNVPTKMHLLHFKNVKKHFIVLFMAESITIFEIVLSAL